MIINADEGIEVLQKLVDSMRKEVEYLSTYYPGIRRLVDWGLSWNYKHRLTNLGDIRSPEYEAGYGLWRFIHHVSNTVVGHVKTNEPSAENTDLGYVDKYTQKSLYQTITNIERLSVVIKNCLEVMLDTEYDGGCSFEERYRLDTIDPC